MPIHPTTRHIWSKFSDTEFLKYYNMGLSDGKIARIFGVSRSAIRRRRIKLHLPANHPSNNPFTPNLTVEQLIELHQKMIEKTRKHDWKKHIPNVRRRENSKRYRERHKEELLKKHREWIEKHPNYQREYYYRNLEKCRAYARNWYRRNKEKALKQGKDYRGTKFNFCECGRLKLKGQHRCKACNNKLLGLRKRALAFLRLMFK